MTRNLGDLKVFELLLHGRRVARGVRVSCSNLRRMLHFVIERRVRHGLQRTAAAKSAAYSERFSPGERFTILRAAFVKWREICGHGVEEGVTLLSKQKEYNNKVVGIWAHL